MVQLYSIFIVIYNWKFIISPKCLLGLTPDRLGRWTCSRPHLYPVHCSIRKADINRCAFVDLRFGPDASTVALHDALCDGQADAGAFELLGAVETLKGSEKLRR